MRVYFSYFSEVEGDGWLSFREWVLKLVARLLATATLLVRIQTSLKNTKWRHKQRSGQHTLARQKCAKKLFKLKNVSQKLEMIHYVVEQLSLQKVAGILQTFCYEKEKNKALMISVLLVFSLMIQKHRQ
jgi:hypothetical protein